MLQPGAGRGAGPRIRSWPEKRRALPVPGAGRPEFWVGARICRRCCASPVEWHASSRSKGSHFELRLGAVRSGADHCGLTPNNAFCADFTRIFVRLLMCLSGPGKVGNVVENPRPGSLGPSSLRSIGWAAVSVAMVTVVVAITEHDKRWGYAVGLATVAALVATRAVGSRRSLPDVRPLMQETPRSTLVAAAGVLTVIWVIDVLAVGVVRSDAGTYAPGGLILVYVVGAVVALLWVASVLALAWSWTNRSRTEPPLSART